MRYKCAEQNKIPLRFTNNLVEEGQHICFIYNDDADRKSVIAKFLKSGFKENEKLLYLIDVMIPNEMLNYFNENIIMDVLEIHPVMISVEQSIKNSYYIGQKNFLKNTKQKL